MATFCRACRSMRPLEEMLIVRRVKDGGVSYICRPGLPPERMPPCISAIGPRDVETIEIAEIPAGTRNLGAPSDPGPRVSLGDLPASLDPVFPRRP